MNCLPEQTSLEEKIIASAEAALYRALPDPMDKFIMAFHFHLGYSQIDTMLACNFTKKSVWTRIRKIRALLESKKLSERAIENMG